MKLLRSIQRAIRGIFALIACVGILVAPKVNAAPDVDYTLPVNALARAIFSEIKVMGLEDSELGRLYRQRAYLPIWFGDPARARRALQAMTQSHEQGLPDQAYGAFALSDLYIRSADVLTQAQAELTLTGAYVKFARHLNSGILNPKSVDREIQTKPDIKSPEFMIATLVRSGSADGLVERLRPADPEYTALLAERAHLERQLVAGEFGKPIPKNRMLRPGYEGERVLLVRKRLRALGYRVSATGEIYDEPLEEVVRQFQGDQKLSQDAIIGPATISRLNAASPEDRLAQVLVNLERLRWLNIDKGPRHIRVNIPDFSMAVYDEGEVTFRSRVVVGKNTWDRRTPEFSDVMTHMVINPYWHVPKSIARREYLPMLKRDSRALVRRGLILLNRNGKVLQTVGRDFSGYSESYFPFFIKQPPGSKNALGRVKFMFPNKNNIYLHDTPAKNLFEKDRRAYSHGCIRVARPFDLAYHLLDPQSNDPVGVFHTHLDRKKERQVDLENPIQIHLTYRTAFAGEDGKVVYREDVYGRDETVYKALRSAGVDIGALQG